MKKTALSFLIMSLLAANVMANNAIEVSEVDKEIIAEELEKEAELTQDSRSKTFFKNLSSAFRESRGTDTIGISSRVTDCVDCSKRSRAKKFFTKLGFKSGKAVSWLSTTTSKPFMASAGFFTGIFEKDKNQVRVAMSKFLLNHQHEFDDLYLEAGTREEMIELMLLKIEDIMENKSRILMKDFLLYACIDKDLTTDFVLTEEEIASIDPSKLDPAFINNHPEYQELRPILGDMSKQDLLDIVNFGYFSKSISFENYRQLSPENYELFSTAVAHYFLPQMALQLVSGTLASMYGVPVLAISVTEAFVCSDKSIQTKFETNADLKSFCSYLTNKSHYELSKSRAKGYVRGKKVRRSIRERIRERRARRELKKSEERDFRVLPH